MKVCAGVNCVCVGFRVRVGVCEGVCGCVLCAGVCVCV